MSKVDTNWKIVDDCICESNGRAILSVDAIGGETEEEVKANIQLITSARMMLSALKDAHAYINDNNIRIMVGEAIMEAMGE